MNKSSLSSVLPALLMVFLPWGLAKAQPPFLGENLAVEITFLKIPVVNATLRVTEETAEGDRPIYHLAVWAKTTPFYSLLYRVNNRYDSFFTWPQGHTLRYERHIQETGWTLRRVVTYQEGYAVYDGQRRVLVPAETRDLFSALYALRGQPLENNRVSDSSLDLDGQTWMMRAVVLGREQVQTDMGLRRAVKVQIRFLSSDRVQGNKRESDVLTNNLVREKTKVIIWLSDDERKTPLKAQFRLAPFSIKATFCTLN